MKKLFPVLALLVAFWVSSCEDNEITVDPEAAGHAYYPVQLGTYRVYQVQETTYRNDIGQTVEFQIREKVDEVSADQTGRTWYRVEISRRENSADTWRVQGLKLLSPTATDFRILENNQTYVHLVFPVENGKTWFFNPLNAATTRARYGYAKVAEAFAEGAVQYDNTVTLVQAETDPDNTVLSDNAYEVLAKGVGPVLRFFQSYRYCDDSQEISCTGYGTKFIVTGTQRTETLVESGKLP